MQFTRFSSLTAVAALSFSLFFLNGCDKQTTEETTNTTPVEENNTVDAYYQDVFGTVNQVADEGNITGRTSQTQSICADITLSPNDTISFPKTVTIDFGTATPCTSPDGTQRKGKIIAVFSDKLRKSGTTISVSFDNYYVNNNKVEGTMTLTNTTTAGVPSFSSEVKNGKVTWVSGDYNTFTGTRTITMTSGKLTKTVLDDVFTLTGSSSGENSAGYKYTAQTGTPIEITPSCKYLSKGTINANVTIPIGKKLEKNFEADVDFGTGSCDNTYTLTVDGKTTTKTFPY